MATSALEACCKDEIVYIEGLLEGLAHNSRTKLTTMVLLLQKQSMYTSVVASFQQWTTPSYIQVLV